MNDFYFYFQLGWNHIISIEAIDHLLFITVLTSLYHMSQWKQVLSLITAFTIGHSLTLVLSSLSIVRFNSNVTEFLIPLTILLTGIFNILQNETNHAIIRLNYTLALLFGLIHGMGFANSIRFMLASHQQIAFPLFSFNLGIEAGQILLVLTLLFVGLVITDVMGLKQKNWKFLLSVSSGLAAMYLCMIRWPF